MGWLPWLTPLSKGYVWYYMIGRHVFQINQSLATKTLAPDIKDMPKRLSTSKLTNVCVDVKIVTAKIPAVNRSRMKYVKLSSTRDMDFSYIAVNRTIVCNSNIIL